MTHELLTVDELEVELRHSPRRRSIELAIGRTGAIVVTAPAQSPRAAVEDFVRDRKTWVYQKLARKEALRQSIPRKQYLTGEGFLYLGRSHRLLLVATQDRPLSLRAGRFSLVRAESAAGRLHFVRWYTDHARRWLPHRVEGLAARLRRKPTAVRIQDLGYRWASCGGSGGLNFHWAVMTLPPPIIDYIVLHELLHLEIPDHSPRFWRRLRDLAPTFELQRKWLSERGGAGVL